MVKKSSPSRRTTSNSEPKVQHIRLANGDEIIGFVLGETKHHITVDHPLIVVQVADEKGSYTALQRYIPFSAEKLCNFQKIHVIAATDIHPEIEKYYYLSLKFSSTSEHKMIDHIRNANHTMEQALISKTRVSNLEDKLIHIVPGTDSRN